MPVLRIRNMDGRLQFAAPFKSLQLVRKGTVQTDTSIKIGNTSPSGIRIPSAGSKTALIAIRAPFFTAKFGVSQASDGTWQQTYACDAGGGQTVEYYIFDQASLIDAPGPCLRLRNPNTGELLYNSNVPLMNVVDIATVGIGIQYPDGRKYAAIQTSIAGHNMSTEALYRDGQPWIDDGSGGMHTWSRRNDGKLYGPRFLNLGTLCDEGEVSFDDVIVQAPGYASEPDPARVYWTIETAPTIIVDVTNL